jgi:LacI family transcriptional regulator
LLVDHLFALGHRRFFNISGPTDWVSARHRESGFHAALRKRGLTAVGSAVSDWSASSGHDVVAGLAEVDFTALVAANDLVALGAILALEERGVAVPRDVSVVGFDDLPEAAFFRPPLTTLRQDFRRQGEVAMSHLLQRIGVLEGELPPHTMPLLVARSSTAPPSS